MKGFVNYLGTGSDSFTGGIEIYYKNRLKKASIYIFFSNKNTNKFDNKNIITKIYFRFFRKKIKNPFYRKHFDWYFKLYTAMKKEAKNLEVVEVADSFGYGIIPRLLKIPYVVKIHTPHSVVCELNGWKKDFYYRIIKIIEMIALQKAEKIISPSKAMIDFLINNGWKIKTHKVTILNNGLYNHPKYNKKISNKKQILFVGNLEPRKNLFFMLRNFVTNHIFHNFTLTICGANSFIYDKKTCKSISYWDYCCEKIPNIKTNSRIDYKGFIKNEEIHNFYQNAEFLIICSHKFENFPTVILEAFQNGVIVIGSKVGGILEMIEDGKNGFLFDDNSDESFITTFRRALNCDKKNIKAAALQKLNEINKQIEVSYE